MLGSSADQNVSLLCETKEEGKELVVEIYADAEGDKVFDQQEEKEGDDKEATPSICTITLRAKFTPSTKDLMEELYDQLNNASQKKRKAVMPHPLPNLNQPFRADFCKNRAIHPRNQNQRWCNCTKRIWASNLLVDECILCTKTTSFSLELLRSFTLLCRRLFKVLILKGGTDFSPLY